MRTEFVKAVDEVMGRDDRALFITGDLGFNALEPVAARHGRRFINAGVAEQSMIGIAAGAALCGMRPWVYSIAPFATYRCLEQIRNDVCLHALPVRIAGNGGGYTYGIMGATHHALEDIAALKALPNLSLFFPCANDHVAAAVALMDRLPGPAYLRLAFSAFNVDRRPLEENPTTLTRVYARRSDVARPGVTVIGVGHGVQVACKALGEGLEALNADVFGVARLPLQLAADSPLTDSVRQTRSVIVLEEHYAPGSVGESLRMALPAIDDFQLMTAVYRPDGRYGSPVFHMQQSNLTPAALIAAVKERVESR